MTFMTSGATCSGFFVEAPCDFSGSRVHFGASQSSGLQLPLRIIIHKLTVGCETRTNAPGCVAIQPMVAQMLPQAWQETEAEDLTLAVGSVDSFVTLRTVDQWDG